MAINQYTFKRHGVGLPDVTMPIDRALYSVNGGPMASTAGKIVCVGRNYADHAKELGNEVPESPLLFMKPSSAIQPLHGERLRIPTGQGACHHELELAVLIGGLMQGVSADNALTNVAGYALGLDLTLRDLQDALKAKGHPWERAKAFDGSAALGPFVSANVFGNVSKASFQLERNGVVQQEGKVTEMIFSVADLLAEISSVFTLEAGDIVFTGTPAGVGPLAVGDNLSAKLITGNGQEYAWKTRVVGR
ncbi:isomerase/hydrolase [Aliidiomarina shirensis]|uniref:Isomerase/hydrolase n=1 Tax=Aliidiomarina shirensis TaxID=1048642 RepID=A0A432WTY3_9GAMM|nr:fumarylacetoacetate hydrolase family protein [Aliidiomarina shirensis]RUO37219.1 isomerase/hydrolase [Aliidiomarina shirensis]